MNLEDLVDEAYRDPRRIRQVVERAFALGGGTIPQPVVPPSARAIADRLRRKAKVTQEFDGRSALLEMAAELDPEEPS